MWIGITVSEADWGRSLQENSKVSKRVEVLVRTLATDTHLMNRVERSSNDAAAVAAAAVASLLLGEDTLGLVGRDRERGGNGERVHVWSWQRVMVSAASGVCSERVRCVDFAAVHLLCSRLLYSNGEV